MFGKISKSIVDTVNQVLDQPVEEGVKIPTSTGTRVLGSRYGNSAKAHLDQTKKDIDKIKGPTTKQLTGKDEVKEELKGDQEKIDANHNNKIDADDFKILRAKKKMKESYFVNRLLDNASLAEEVEEELNEVLSKDASAGDWIHDFIHSDNPKFKGKTKAERKKMALGAYYAKQNEAYENSKADKEEDAKEAKKRGMTHAEWEKSEADKKQDKKHDMKEAAPAHMSDDEITTDTLAGRVAGGKSNSFQSFKMRVAPTDKEGDDSDEVPGEKEPEDTHARTSIKAKAGLGDKVDNLDPKYGKPNAFKEETVEESFADEHGIGRDIADKKEKMDRLKTPAKPGPLHNVAKGFKAFIQGKKEPMESVEVEGEQLDEKNWIAGAIKKPGAETAAAKSAGMSVQAYAQKHKHDSGKSGKRARLALTLNKLNKEETLDEKKDLSPGQDDAPFEPPYTTGKPDNVKDKSGAVHTPMSRARDLARQAMKRVKTEMLGKAPGNNG